MTSLYDFFFLLKFILDHYGITNGMVKQTLSLLTKLTYRISCHCLNVFHHFFFYNLPQCLYAYITMEYFYHKDIQIFFYYYYYSFFSLFCSLLFAYASVYTLNISNLNFFSFFFSNKLKDIICFHCTQNTP